MHSPKNLLGPLNIVFDRSVLRYLRTMTPSPLSNPSGGNPLTEKQCLEQFFRDIQVQSVPNRYKVIGNGDYLIAACKHVITITGKGKKVANVSRGTLP